MRIAYLMQSQSSSHLIPISLLPLVQAYVLRYRQPGSSSQSICLSLFVCLCLSVSLSFSPYVSRCLRGWLFFEAGSLTVKRPETAQPLKRNNKASVVINYAFSHPRRRPETGARDLLRRILGKQSAVE